MLRGNNLWISEQIFLCLLFIPWIMFFKFFRGYNNPLNCIFMSILVMWILHSCSLFIIYSLVIFLSNILVFNRVVSVVSIISLLWLYQALFLGTTSLQILNFSLMLTNFFFAQWFGYYFPFRFNRFLQHLHCCLLSLLPLGL